MVIRLCFGLAARTTQNQPSPKNKQFRRTQDPQLSGATLFLCNSLRFHTATTQTQGTTIWFSLAQECMQKFST